MTTRANTIRPASGMSPRMLAAVAGTGLLAMAILAPLAHFGVLEALVVPADAGATLSNLRESEGLFRAAIAAFLVVTFLDLVLAWALYQLLKPTSQPLALLTGWLRLAAAAAFVPALANLLDVAQLVGRTGTWTPAPAQLESQVMASIASFRNGWDLVLAVFGLHLLGVGVLVFKSVQFPRFLGALIVIAGGGYLADTFTRILAPNFDFTFSLFTFIGEPLLIVWLFWRVARGFRSESSERDGRADPLLSPAPISS